MELKRLIIRGVPKAQKRAKFTNRGGFIRGYDPSVKDKSDIIAQIKMNAPEKPFKDPLNIIMYFEMPRPNNHYGTGKKVGMLKPNAPDLCDKKPDIDNLMKIVMDSMNKLYFRDDSLIVAVSAVKYYGDSPKTEIVILSIKEKAEFIRDLPF